MPEGKSAFVLDDWIYGLTRTGVPYAARVSGSSPPGASANASTACLNMKGTCTRSLRSIHAVCRGERPFLCALV